MARLSCACQGHLSWGWVEVDEMIIYVVDHLRREGDDIGLAQLGDGLDHGGRWIGREVRGWIRHRLSEENP